MSDRQKPHNGRDTAGHFKVKQADVDDLRTEPQGEEFVRDDVRLGGAVEDIGSQAGERGARIGDLVSENEEDVERTTRRDRGEGSGQR
jgi:hypothetical protein